LIFDLGCLAVRKIWRTMCVSINGPGDLEQLTLKLLCESHLRWGTFLPNLDTLGLWVLELFAMYATDGRTDGRTKATLIAPFLVRGIIKSNDSILKILIKCTLSHLQHMLCSLSTTSPTTKRLLNAKKSRLNSLNGPA